MFFGANPVHDPVDLDIPACRRLTRRFDASDSESKLARRMESGPWIGIGSSFCSGRVSGSRGIERPSCDAMLRYANQAVEGFCMMPDFMPSLPPSTSADVCSYQLLGSGPSRAHYISR